MPLTLILDIDGTLVDTNYQHAIAWHRAFRDHGHSVPLWRVHRHVGMGGDQFVRALVGEEADAAHGDALRDGHAAAYEELIDEVEPLSGAHELLEELRDDGTAVALASSAREEEVGHYLDLLDARDLADAWTTSADVEATKPEPDLIAVAIDKAGGGPAVMIGDTTWDVEAADRAGVATVAVLTGGFGAEELRGAGAAAVYDSVSELLGAIDRPPLSD